MSWLTVTRSGIVVPVRLDPAGITGPTVGQARGRTWRSAGPAHHVPSSVDGSRVQQRIVEAVACLPEGSAATGWAALAWLAPRWFDGVADDGRTTLPVPVAVGDRGTARPRKGVTLSEDWLFDDDVLTVDGLPITVPERSVSYEARKARTDLMAMTHVDMAAFHDLVDLGALASYADRLGSRPGTLRLRRAIAAGNENAWSPQEVRLRKLWADHRPARLLCNAAVFDHAGNHLFTPDVLDPVSGVAGEYDGDVHAGRERRRHDLGRQESAQGAGIEVVTMIGGHGEDQAFLRRLDAAHDRARARTGPRRWTLDQPAWWVDTSTVARRRALSGEQAARWLAHRRRT